MKPDIESDVQGERSILASSFSLVSVPTEQLRALQPLCRQLQSRALYIPRGLKDFIWRCIENDNVDPGLTELMNFIEYRFHWTNKSVRLIRFDGRARTYESPSWNAIGLVLNLGPGDIRIGKPGEQGTLPENWGLLLSPATVLEAESIHPVLLALATPENGTKK